ncbi:purine and uridine phosphorylase, partial [Aureobasidium melanogenum]
MSDPQQYTVGWICAITTEYTAARQFLDEEHDRPDHVSANDSNAYTLGKMAGHNVVIAVLPDGEYGVSSATAVAKDMLNSFPNVRIGLMVGIGGGAPTAKHDIRLGDVVVSSRRGNAPCVYQYNYGKTIQGRNFQPTGFLNQPPTVVRTAVSDLRSKYEDDGHHIEARIMAILDRKPSVVHPADDEHSCEEVCGSHTADLIQRHGRREDEDNPTIHYGVIASADQLMKDAITRDAIAKEKDVLCFEMEAAGLMNHFPCLVIRGICDYSDSHKNKEWQGYAAMTAAAYAKDLLRRMIPSRVEHEERLGKVLSEIEEGVARLCEETKSSTDVLKEHAHSTKQHLENEALRYQSEEHRKCHQVFKTSTYEHFKNINPDRVKGTCQWALIHPQYQRWNESDTNDLLWISADPGCGKSVLSKSLVDEKLMSDTAGSTICYFFFKDNDEQNSLATGLCALLHQLFQHQPHFLQHAVPAWHNDGSKLQQETDKLWRILLAATSDAAAHNTICVLDALDECKEADRSNLIAKLARFHNSAAVSQHPRQSWLKFIVTSRPYDDIQRGFQDIPPSLPAIRLRGEEENDQIRVEINRVINLRVLQLANELGLRETTSSRLEQTLLAMEHRTYLWLHLAIDDIRTTLQDSLRPDEEPIDSIPSSVESAYEKILRRVSGALRQTVKLILQIIVGARRPLTVGEMALALGLTTSKQHRTSADAQINAVHLENQLRHCGESADVEEEDAWGRTALLLASMGGHSDTFQILLEAGADWDARCDYGTPLQAASKQGHDKLVQILLDRGADVNAQGGDDGSALQAASAGGYDNIVRMLLDRGADVNDQSGDYTALQVASARGYDRIVQMLLNEGADVNVYDRYGDTALRAASARGHDNVVRILLNKGAHVSPQSGRPGSALRSASAGGYDNIVRMLLNKGADVNAQSGVSGNALHLASLAGHENIVQVLLDRGADVNAQDRVYGNALITASFEGYDNIVLMLLNEGADVNAQGGEHGNALQAASIMGRYKIVQMLLNKGADINFQGGRYGNALQAALKGGHEEIVQMLLDAKHHEVV